MYRSVDGRTPSDGYGFVGFALPNSKFYVQELISPGNKGTRIVCGCTKSVNHNTEWVKRRETGDGRRETGDGRRETGDAGRETLDAGSGKLEGGSWKLEAGSWKLEAGSWKLDAGSWSLEVGSW